MNMHKEDVLLSLGQSLLDEHPCLQNMTRPAILAMGELYYDAGVESIASKVECVDLLGQKPNGEVVLLGKVKKPEIMKAKEIICEMFGHGDFDDDMGDHCLYLAMFEQFIAWQKEQASV